MIPPNSKLIGNAGIRHFAIVTFAIVDLIRCSGFVSGRVPSRRSGRGSVRSIQLTHNMAFDRIHGVG